MSEIQLSRRNFLKSTVAFAAATGLSLPAYDAGLVKDWNWYNGTGRDVGPYLQFLVDNYPEVNVPSGMTFTTRSVVELTKGVVLDGGMSRFECYAECFLTGNADNGEQITIQNLHIVNRHRELQPHDFSTMDGNFHFYTVNS